MAFWPDLKPCPFCGCAAKLYGTPQDGYLHCPNDACSVKPSVYSKRLGYKGSLIAAWNTRASACDEQAVS